MIKTQESFLHTEMERVKSFMKLTPEEKRKVAKRHMYEELKAMVRRLKITDREEEEKERKERKRQVARQSEEEERGANEQKSMEKAKEHWEKVMMVKKEPVRCTISALKKEQQQQRRQEEAELCCLSKVRECLTSDLRTEDQEKKKTLYNNWDGEPVKDKSHTTRATCLRKSEAGGFMMSPKVEECLTSELRAKEQGKKKTLYNNWVGESIKDKSNSNSASAPETTDANPSRVFQIKGSLLDTTEREKPKTPKEIVQWLQDRLNVGHWVDKYQDHRKKQDEKRRLKAEEQYAKFIAFKAKYASLRCNCYTEGAAQSRNRILKSIF